MKKDVEENISKKFKKKPKNMQLMKKAETKDNTKIFGSTFSNNFSSVNKATNHLLYQKKVTTKQPHKFNLASQSMMNRNTFNTENYTSNNKTNISFGTNTYRYNQNKKNNINNKTTSSFYISKEEKNKDKKIPIKNVKKFVLNLSLNDNIKKRNGNNTNIIGNSLTYRNNINTNNDLNKQSTIRKKINKDKNQKQNKITNKEKINDGSRKNKFERAKTVVKLKTQKNQEKNNSRRKSKDKIEQIDKEKKGYNNLYDKYLDKFKERMHKISLIKNYRNDDDIKDKKILNKSINKQGMIQRYKTQTNFFKKKDKKDNEINNLKKTKEVQKKQTTKIKIEKRKVGKSVGIKLNKDKNKEKEIELKNNIRIKNTQNNNNIIKIPKRSKSMAKLTEKSKKNLNEDKYDIDYILYEKIKPSKNEDPFDDIDSIVKQINFNVIRLKSKNIFNVEDNDKYENYKKNFDEIFSKAILDNNLRKSIEKNKNNDNNSNILQNENTTDSFKKNKINVSFIENQHN